MIPDVEAVLCNYLRAHPAVAAVGARVGTKSPPTHVDPWARVTLLDAPSKGGVEHLIDSMVQIDCFAGDTAIGLEEGLAEANDLARAARAALDEMKGQAIDSVVFSDVRIVGFMRDPDTVASEPARDRYLITAEIAFHG